MCAAAAVTAEPPPLDVDRVLAIQAGDDWWEQADIADFLGVRIGTIHRWRWESGRYTNAGLRVPCAPMLLPKEDKMQGSKPLWHKRTIVQWGMWSGRVTPDGHAGMFKPGRRSRHSPVLPPR